MVTSASAEERLLEIASKLWAEPRQVNPIVSAFVGDRWTFEDFRVCLGRIVLPLLEEIERAHEETARIDAEYAARMQSLVAFIEELDRETARE